MFSVQDLMEGPVEIVSNSVVTFHYTLRDEAGDETETSRGGEPSAYLHGANNVIPGLENAMTGKSAGDVFAGAIIFATLQQWTASQKLRFACAASAIKCRGLGNRDALPALQAVFDLMEKHPSDADAER